MAAYISPKSDPQRFELIQELRQIQKSIELTRIQFNQTTEKELIEQCVYELNALQSRYAYFLRLIRELDQPVAL